MGSNPIALTTFPKFEIRYRPYFLWMMVHVPQDYLIVFHTRSSTLKLNISHSLNNTWSKSQLCFKIPHLMGDRAVSGLKIGLIIVILSGCWGTAFAHGGGLDSNGCHHDRKNGGYHCHGKN